eukprot:TRINITY_DN20218_c0_g1_i1.p2 TRINITY_DN20218_c0_g1~~TRINITY_DN20218_c0_g1_i1.p2  ORF type:complete len:156 (+),score=38.33 TRINITY_DN20218_c0_g1_i1:250-717(+)
MAEKKNLSAPRKLELGDFEKGHLDLLSQLTKIGDTNKAQYTERFNQINNNPDYYIAVIEDLDTGRLVASGTVLIERKFIRNTACSAHIEDIVTDKDYRGQGLGRTIIQHLVEHARNCGQGVYKVLLDCTEGNMEFYRRAANFSDEKKEVQMILYL